MSPTPGTGDRWSLVPAFPAALLTWQACSRCRGRGAPGWRGNGWKPQTRKRVLFSVTPPLAFLFPTRLWPLLPKAVRSHVGTRRKEPSPAPSLLPRDTPRPDSAPAPFPLPPPSRHPQPQQLPSNHPSICPSVGPSICLSLYFMHSC